MSFRRIALLLALFLALEIPVADAAGKGGRKAASARLQRKAASAKFQRVARFEADGHGRLKRRVRKTLAAPKLDQATALAAIVRIMDTTYMRVGSERYAKKRSKASFGAASLRKNQVRVSGDKVSFDFRGKSGVMWQRTVRDRELAGALEMFLRAPGKRLFKVGGEAVTEVDVRDYLRPFGVLPKDLRTLHANRLLRNELRRLGAPTRPKLDLAIKRVAAKLGHTPAVARSAYLDPVAIAAYLRQARP